MYTPPPPLAKNHPKMGVFSFFGEKKGVRMGGWVFFSTHFVL